jgi:hypothetical protein
MAMPTSAARRRGIVDPVTGHRHHLAGSLQRAHDAQLLRGVDAGEHADLAHQPAQGGIVGRLQFDAGCHPAMVDAGLSGDGKCSGRVVAGDHHHPDTGTPAAGHRIGNTLAQGIGETDQAQPAQRPRCPSADGHRQHPQATFGHRRHLPLHLPARLRRQPAEVGHRLGRTLGHLADGTAGGLPAADDGHASGPQTAARDRRQRRQPVAGTLSCAVVQGAFHRVGRLDIPGQQGGTQQVLRPGRRQWLIDRVHAGVRRAQLGDRHAVAGQGAGLVGAPAR